MRVLKAKGKNTNIYNFHWRVIKQPHLNLLLVPKKGLKQSKATKTKEKMKVCTTQNKHIKQYIS